jgi:drug/metabolite transporter (DMT)-like permease
MAASTLGTAAALSCALTWALLSFLVRHLTRYFSPLSLNVIRSGLGTVLLIPILVATRDLGALRDVSPLAWGYLTASVILAVGIGDTAFFESTRSLGLARAMTISTSYPLLASALTVTLFGERITPAIAAGSVITLGGLVVIVSERSPVAAGAAEARGRGLALAAVAAVSWALSAAVLKPALQEVDPISAQAVRMPLATLILWATPWARGTLRGLWAHRHATGLAILALGVLTAYSAVAFMAGVKYAGVTLGTVLSSVAPLFALPVGRLFLAEPVTWRAVVGAALAVAGIGVLSL